MLFHHLEMPTEITPLNQKPLFIVLEGIDGSGSTTQGDKLTAWLRSKKCRVLFTHEPSSGPAGMLIRLALSRRLRGASGELHARDAKAYTESSELDPYSLALLYAADRMDHLVTEIVPNLRSGRIVICDRYLLSTLAYQGMSVDEEWLLEINRFCPVPDLCVYLDLPVEFAKDRMQRTRWTRDLYEEESKLREIRDRYLKLVSEARPEYGPIVTVDASLPPEKVARRLQQELEGLVGKTKSVEHKGSLSLFDWNE